MICAFGDYELDTQRYELRRNGQPCKIEPQVFNVLAYLVRHHDRTVTRQELLDQLWSGQFVSDSVLSYCIMAARKAVGDSGRTQQAIKTLHGRGFRFIAAVEEHGNTATATDQQPHPATPASTRPPPRPSETPPPAPPQPEALSAPDAVLDEEHTLVTVLCATLSKTAALHEHLGFAAWQRLRQAFFSLGQEVAQQYGGTLQFYGADGVLVLFGPPHAGAEQAHRAVQAALGLQRRLHELQTTLGISQPAEPAIRLGVHTGPVAIARLSNDQRIASSDLGQTANLAVWLQYLAEPGTLLISEATRRATQTDIRDTAPREVHVPGNSHPVRAYAVPLSDV
jgi:DNA-binding winged helix-turn-helix (wHTH) protein